MRTHGPSTGSCAAAAAKAAALHAQGRNPAGMVAVPLPGGGRMDIALRSWGGHRLRPWASVRKPHSEDPDATRGAVVSVSLRRASALAFRAGTGVGIVCRPGLSLRPGEPAINPGPRAQIAAALGEVGGGPWIVTVSVAAGEAIAARTFNAKMGIVGGLSILGTAGIVRPWSTEAMVASVSVHLDVVRASGQDIALLVPGHMGAAAARRRFQGLEAVEVGNSWADSLDGLRPRGFRELVLVGHPGKLVKLAQGQWDTHSGAGSGAVAWSRRLLRRCGRNTDQVGTMEELVSIAPRSDVDLLARMVARAARRRARTRSRVVFVDLAGDVVGEGEA